MVDEKITVTGYQFAEELKKSVSDQVHSLLDEMASKLPIELLRLLNQRDGAAQLLLDLPRVFSPRSIVSDTDEQPIEQRAWELSALYFRNLGRWYEALALFSALYDHMLLAQEQLGRRFHKGTPLVWMSDCYSVLDCPVLAKRYLMLTLCEDAIRECGVVTPNTSGVYFRLVWSYGLADSELKRYYTEIYDLATRNPSDSKFPEWLLQEIDQNWMVELPSMKEASLFVINPRYVNDLIGRLGEPTGNILERLASYILACMPGCRTTRRTRSHSTDYDIVCSMEGFDLDFRSELGRYFVCECKDWNTVADFTTFAKFCRVLDSTKSRFGILFSKMGFSGQGKTIHADREQLKVYQDRGMVIIVIDQDDLLRVANGTNFINLLRRKYEGVRLDIAKL
jgi:hypothetical protein